jgi:UDP-N-acetyl-D-glucosamine dehydrogenase
MDGVSIRTRIETGKATIGVVGLGYVGLPLAIAYAGKSFPTRGFDLASRRVTMLNAGRNYIQDVSDEELDLAVEKGIFAATDSFSDIGLCDVVFIAVPTPVTAHKDPDTAYIESATRSIAEHLRSGQLIILKSTTYPNTTEGLVLPILEEAAAKKGLTLGEDYFLAFSPERIDPGNQDFTTENTPVVVGGVTEACTDLAALALEQIIPNVHCVSSPGVAEMEKLLENIFRSVNIALVNELARLCDRMGGVSIWEVVEAAATKPFGFMPFFPGPGLGGHCIPIDPYYLSWLARKYDFETSFITLAARVNEDMPFYVSQAVTRAIADQPVMLKDAKVLVLGAAFKKDVDDMRHSPALRVMEILCENGICDISYSDPHVPEIEIVLGGEKRSLRSVDLTDESIGEYNAVVIVTDHTDFPYSMIARSARAIVDTRNALKDVQHDRDKVYLLGGGQS